LFVNTPARKFRHSDVTIMLKRYEVLVKKRSKTFSRKF